MEENDKGEKEWYNVKWGSIKKRKGKKEEIVRNNKQEISNLAYTTKKLSTTNYNKGKDRRKSGKRK